MSRTLLPPRSLHLKMKEEPVSERGQFKFRYPVVQIIATGLRYLQLFVRVKDKTKLSLRLSD
jgi:hypothetical protein